MKRLSFILGLPILFIFAACNPANEFETELSEIDSLIAHIEKREAELDGIEFDSLKMMVDHVNKNEELIGQYYRPDTLDEDFGRLMNECKGIRKKLTNLDKKYIDYGDEMNAIKHQFMDLKEDILNGILGKEKIDEYLTKEKKDWEVTELTFVEFNEMQKKQSKVYYVSVPKVDQYLERIITESDTLSQ